MRLCNRLFYSLLLLLATGTSSAQEFLPLDFDKQGAMKLSRQEAVVVAGQYLGWEFLSQPKAKCMNIDLNSSQGQALQESERVVAIHEFRRPVVLKNPRVFLAEFMSAGLNCFVPITSLEEHAVTLVAEALWRIHLDGNDQAVKDYLQQREKDSRKAPLADQFLDRNLNFEQASSIARQLMEQKAQALKAEAKSYARPAISPRFFSSRTKVLANLGQLEMKSSREIIPLANGGLRIQVSRSSGDFFKKDQPPTLSYWAFETDEYEVAVPGMEINIDRGGVMLDHNDFSKSTLSPRNYSLKRGQAGLLPATIGQVMNAERHRTVAQSTGIQYEKYFRSCLPIAQQSVLKEGKLIDVLQFECAMVEYIRYPGNSEKPAIDFNRKIVSLHLVIDTGLPWLASYVGEVQSKGFSMRVNANYQLESMR